MYHRLKKKKDTLQPVRTTNGLVKAKLRLRVIVLIWLPCFGCTVGKEKVVGSCRLQRKIVAFSLQSWRERKAGNS